MSSFKEDKRVVNHKGAPFTDTVSGATAKTGGIVLSWALDGGSEAKTDSRKSTASEIYIYTSPNIPINPSFIMYDLTPESNFFAICSLKFMMKSDEIRWPPNRF
jgi:hypothetical protein